jgi:hypothetical protein
MLGAAPTIALAKSKARRALKILIFGGLGFLALILLVVALARLLETFAPALSASDDSITAEKLIYDYNANEIFADRTYTGKIIVVRGSVGKINKGSGSGLFGASVELSDGNADSDWVVLCELAKDQESRAASLRPGNSIKVHGTCHGAVDLFSQVRLKDCVIESSD